MNHFSRLIADGWTHQRGALRSPTKRVRITAPRGGWRSVLLSGAARGARPVKRNFRGLRALPEAIRYARKLERQLTRTPSETGGPKKIAPMRQMAFSSRSTIEEGIGWLALSRERGALCPCCEQTVKIYKRSLTGSMARVLLLVYRYFQKHRGVEWLHVPSFLTEKRVGVAQRGGDWAKMAHWGLIEQKQDVRADGSKRVGFYRMTALGKRFARGRARVPKYRALYNQRLVDRAALDAETVTVRQALGERFDYAKLMAR